MTAATMDGGGRRSAPREFASAVATIMTKELRSRMRGRRAFVVLTVYLALLAFITYGVYVIVAPQARDAAEGARFGEGFAQANASAFIGQSIFAVLSILQLVLVSVIAPAFTAGQISLEREKQTLDLLVSTPLRPGAIVIGKLATALAFVVLMIVAAVPINAIVLMYSGTNVMVDIVRQQVVLLAAAIGFGAIGIFASALMKRTQAATVVTYSLVIGCILGSAMLFSFWQALAQRDDPFALQPNGGAPEQIRYVNPMVAMLDVVANVEPQGGSRLTRPLYEIFGTDLGVGVQVAVDRGGFIDDEPAGAIFDLRQPGHWWSRFSITFLGVAALLTLASMRLVVPSGMRWVLRRRRAVGPRLEPAVEELEP
jgi:ABC-type transport system involved in multi-copper enzyme maturation permease subunit